MSKPGLINAATTTDSESAPASRAEAYTGGISQ
jgi:hypothetical protein